MGICFCGREIKRRPNAKYCSDSCKTRASIMREPERKQLQRMERERKLRLTAGAYLAGHPDFFETLAEVRNEYQSGTFRLWWELTRYTYGQCPSNNLMRFFKEWLEVEHDTCGEREGAEEDSQVAQAPVGVSPSGRLAEAS